MSAPVIDIAVALVHKSGRWLVARRHDDVHLGGMWEFPGGKIESGESPERTALRELKEECGVEAHAQQSLEVQAHDYGDRIIRMTPVVCRWSRGEPVALGCAECGWLPLHELSALEMPPINRAIIERLAALQLSLGA